MKTITSRQQGALLLEALIAILIFSFGILAVVATQAAAIKEASENKFRVDASFLANEMISRMWFDRVALTAAGSYPAPGDWQARVGSMLPAGSGKIDVTEDPNVPLHYMVTVTVQWTQPGHVMHKYVATAQINGSGSLTESSYQL